MTHYGTWRPYGGSGSILLAVGLFLVASALMYFAIRFHHTREVKRPGKFLSISLIILWLLFVTTFLVAASIYVRVLYQQVGHLTGAVNPITPVTVISAVVSFLIIINLTQRSEPRIVLVSAIVGTIAAPMIFEFPFDLIVMWRTSPPAPAIPFTLLFFLPLILVEISSFTLLTLSPRMKLSRYTLFFLAGMFLIFAIWALFGFTYPATPIPIALNVISKILAFATAISLFLPQKNVVQFASQ